MSENHSILIFQTLLNRLLLKLSTILQVNDNLTVSHYSHVVITCIMYCGNILYLSISYKGWVMIRFFQKEQ